MKLSIVYDNTVFKKELGLKSDWGFSVLIENNNDLILFDTGAKGEILLNNLKILNINPQDISKIVISHEHWDHNGGLKFLMPFLKNIELFSLEHKENIASNIIDYKSQLISKNVYSTGRLNGSPVDEQSLILKGKNGWYVLVGCSHSGIFNILKSAKNFGYVNGIIGGMHGFNDFPIIKDLDLICPCHCTKYVQKIKKIYPDKFISGGVGKVIEI